MPEIKSLPEETVIPFEGDCNVASRVAFGRSFERALRKVVGLAE